METERKEHFVNGLVCQDVPALVAELRELRRRHECKESQFEALVSNIRHLVERWTRDGVSRACVSELEVLLVVYDNKR